MKPSHEVRLICQELSGGKWFDVGLVRRSCEAVSSDWIYTPHQIVDAWVGNGFVQVKLIDLSVKYRFVG